MAYVENPQLASDTSEERGLGADDIVFDSESWQGDEMLVEREADGSPAAGLSTEDWMRALDTQVGDAVMRQLEISVTGTSALFLPPMLEAAACNPRQARRVKLRRSPWLALYLTLNIRAWRKPRSAVMFGTRTETVSYFTQGGGAAIFPKIFLRWYNLETEEIEEIVLYGRTITIAMPPRVRTAADRQKARRGALLLVLVVILGWPVHRWLWPVVVPLVRLVRTAHEKSAFAAYRVVERRAAVSDLGGLVQALEQRAACGHPPSRRPLDALEILTRAIYRDDKTAQDTTSQWQGVRQTLRQDGPGLRRPHTARVVQKWRP